MSSFRSSGLATSTVIQGVIRPTDNTVFSWTDRKRHQELKLHKEFFLQWLVLSSPPPSKVEQTFLVLFDTVRPRRSGHTDKS